MSNLVKTDVNGYVKDRSTSVVLNTNEEQYLAIKAQREKHREMKAMHLSIQSLQNQINDLKSVIFNLIKEKNNG